MTKANVEEQTPRKHIYSTDASCKYVKTILRKQCCNTCFVRYVQGP